MKKIAVALIATISVLGLSACNGSTGPSRLDQRMDRCIAAGGTFKYHGNSGSFDCFLPKTSVHLEDHTS